MKYPLVVLAILVLAAAGYLVPAAITEERGPLLGEGDWLAEPAPDLEDQWTLLTFFLPGREPCVEEVASLRMVSEHWRPRGLHVVGLTTASRAEAWTFAREHGLEFPVLVEAGAEFESYGVDVVPDAFLVDPAGRVVARGLSDARIHLRDHGLPDVPADAPPIIPPGDLVPADLIAAR